MLDTLQKMSGTTHKVYRDGKSITRDMEKLVLQNEGKVTINLSVKEQPVISYNDMAFMPMCNSIVFRAGDSPIWNRNQTCLPMSWRLFSNTISQPGKKYSLQTVPTMSSAADFDVRKNMPDFLAMWEKRRQQALEVESTQAAYRNAYHFDDAGIARLDPDKYADELMQYINGKLGAFDKKDEGELGEGSDGCYYRDDRMGKAQMEYEENQAVKDATADIAAQKEDWERKIYCSNMLSRDMLCPMPSKAPNRQWDSVLIDAFCMCKDKFAGDCMNFRLSGSDECLMSSRGDMLIEKYTAEQIEAEKNAIDEAGARNNGYVFTENESFKAEVHDAYKATDAFYRFLVSLDSWDDIAGGEFEIAVTNLLRGKDNKDK